MYDTKILVVKEDEPEAAVQKEAPVHIPKPACLSPPSSCISPLSSNLPSLPPCLSPLPSYISPPSSCISPLSSCISPLSSSLSSLQQQQKVDKQIISTDTSATEEWIVVTEKKKKPVVPTKAKKTKINNNKYKSRNVTAKNGNNNTLNKKAVSPVPECFVKEEHYDVPFLSDNESMTESIESDFHQPKYYSPFSTGFDFGVFPLFKPTKPQPQEPLTINSRLDEYLSSQQAQWTNNKQQYTQKNSILHLLIQSDQVETTITPTCFKYFDDMMMSTSLYPTNDHVSFSSINKRDWDSFSR